MLRQIIQGSPDISADNIPSAINQSDRTPPDSEAPATAEHGDFQLFLPYDVWDEGPGPEDDPNDPGDFYEDDDSPGPDKADDGPDESDAPRDPDGPYDPYGPFAPDSHDKDLGDCCRDCSGCDDEEFVGCEALLEHEAERWESNRDREREREEAWVKRIEKYFDERTPFPLTHPQFFDIQGVPIKTAKYQVIICFSFGNKVLKGIYTTDPSRWTNTVMLPTR